NGRAGIYYFHSSMSQSGLQFNGSGGTLSGCGVFLMFDPHETGAGGQTVFTVPSGNTVNINSDAQCPNGETMEYSPGAPSGNTPYKWYGYNLPDTNPTSVWV